MIFTESISSAMQNFYNWKAKYCGLPVNELIRMKEENNRPKHIVANLTLENDAIKHVIEKNIQWLGDKREVVIIIVEEMHLIVRQACRIVSLPRSLVSYHKRIMVDRSLIDALHQQVDKYSTIDFWKCYSRLRRKSYSCNHKRLY